MAPALATPQTIAIVLDAAEPTLVRRLMASGDMPQLVALAARGGTATVTSSAAIGSGSVWPTFATCSEPPEHGTHYLRRWEPARMRLVPEQGEHVAPWWRAQAREGRSALTVDVPYLPFADAHGCVEVFEWGSHDRRLGTVQTRPPRLVEEIARAPGPHPFQGEPPPRHDDPSASYLAGAARRAATGAARRGELAARLIGEHDPQLAVVVFAEIHHASHLLWHTVDRGDPLYAGRPLPDVGDRALVDVFRAADAAIGQIVDRARPDARFAVFSLHGMRSAYGIPMLLHPLLAELGYAAVPRPGRLSPRDAGRTAFAAAKRHAPEWARSAWRRSASLPLLNAVAGTTALRAHAWERTRAFVMPHDQHGWIRINLEGREAAGIVPASHYAGICDELAAALLATRTQDGRPVVKHVLRVADGNGGRPPHCLPDLVAHWDDAAYDDPVRVAGSEVVTRPDGRRLTGRHTFEGFLVTGGMAPPADIVPSRELAGLLT